MVGKGLRILALVTALVMGVPATGDPPSATMGPGVRVDETTFAVAEA